MINPAAKYLLFELDLLWQIFFQRSPFYELLDSALLVCLLEPETPDVLIDRSFFEQHHELFVS